MILFAPITGRSRDSFRFVVVFSVLLLAPLVLSQNQPNAASATLRGVVRDSHGNPVPNATVSLQRKPGSEAVTTSTDEHGLYSFRSLAEDSYSLSTDMPGQGKAQFGPFRLRTREVRAIDLTLVSATKSAAMPEFFDEPQFTVAGVTQTGNAGGHGSDTVQRTSDALAKATSALSNSSASSSLAASNAAELQRAREETRAQLARDNKAELHHQLGDIEEKLVNPLEAVREYQRAAEMNPSEPYLFDWGAELLAHRALEPATEVFNKGHRLFPKSSRMVMGLGVALYARGSYDEALQHMFEASDLNPTDATPYLFLGKMQGTETIESRGFVEKFARFATLQPENALANYYYAVSLWKESQRGAKEDSYGKVESLLQKAIEVDPKLGPAYLQLGILFSQKGDLQGAITQYQKAVERDPDLLEARYRLGQVYRRTGQNEKAQRELQLYDELSKKSAEQAERERREIQQFVITLRNANSVSPPD